MAFLFSFGVVLDKQHRTENVKRHVSLFGCGSAALRGMNV